jgi:mono/diheme cytochrome c family protein
MNIKKFRDKTWLGLTVYGSFLFFLALTVAHASGENWKDYQEEYVKKVSGFAGKDKDKSSLGIKVVEVPELGIQDRCTTCHIAMDDLRMFGEENPLKPHPASYLQHHPPDRFGCTPCHGGQGESLDIKKAQSGTFRKGDLVQVSCSSCHTEVALGGAPRVTKGRSLLKDNQCTNCHYAQDLSEAEDFRPAPALSGIGEKVSEKWLWRWLKDPKGYMANATMPRYEIDEKYVDGLVAYLMASKDSRIDPEFEYPEGDVDRGKSVLRLSFCISCHPFNGKGGKEAGDLGRIGNKVEEKWLVQMLTNPHMFQPNTPMPQYNLSLQQMSDMAAYLLEEFTDYDMLDEDEGKKLPTFWTGPEERSEIGRRVYKELRCANCHGLAEETGWWRKIGPDFTSVGEKPIKEINFGNSKVPRTLPDYVFEKVRDPQIYAAPDNFMKMPKYDFPNEEIRDIVLALLSFNSDKVAVEDYRFPNVKRRKIEPEVPAPPILSSETTVVETYHPTTKAEIKKYEPEGEFGRLVNKFRCFSCHSFKGRGNNISYDLTAEGSRVRRQWLFNYLKLPYSIRPILTIRMPIFNLTDREAKILTNTFMRKMVDPEIERDLEGKLTAEMAEQGKELFEEKGCLGCHQVGKKGGYVGPSFTQGAFVGEKLQAGWIPKWLKNSRAMKPDVLEPNYGLSDEEALALTSYLMSIKTPEKSGSRKR